MPADTLFGVAYLDAESFRATLELFGVGMAFRDYVNGNPDDVKLQRVLQAASRAIDGYCGRLFTPDDITETHALDLDTWQFPVNNPPVASVTSCTIQYAIDGSITVDPARVFKNNQSGYLEITRDIGDALVAQNAIAQITDPVVLIVYKSYESVPYAIKLATGYQAGHLINSGYADKMLPPNMGKLDISGLAVNNKKGYRSSEEQRAGSISADAERLLAPFKSFVVA